MQTDVFNWCLCVCVLPLLQPVMPLLLQVLLQDPKERYALPLAQKQQLNHDTFFMRFALPSPDFKMGLPCGKHVFLCAGEPVRQVGLREGGGVLCSRQYSACAISS
jgi:hypothetical protein